MRATYFVTGTDTDAGKTLVSCGLLVAAAAQGRKVAGLKPVAAGCVETPDGLRNDDALALMAASNLPLSYDEVNPVALAPAMAPHLAASAAGRRLSVRQLSGYVRAAASYRPDLLLIEGAGGWWVPLSEREYLSGLARELQLPVILVVGLRLGCLNHALLTVGAIRADGARLAGWVGTVLDPAMPGLDATVATLRERLPAPCLGIIPHLSPPDAAAAAEYLDLAPLLPASSGKA